MNGYTQHSTTHHMLARRFVLHGLENTTWLWFLIAAGLVAGVCITLLYRYERRLVSRRLGATLLTLRLAVVAAVFATLLEPVIAWTINRERTGRVLLAVDVSDSMSTADKHGDAAEKLQWLRALKMIGNAATDERLDRWEEAFANDREPEWVTADEVPDPKERAALAASRKQNLEEMFDTIGQMPRRELARRLILSGPSNLQAKLDKLAILEYQAFAGSVASAADAAAFDELVQNPVEDLHPEASDLMQGVVPATDADSSETPLAGVVLFTDGRDNVQVDGGRLLARLGNLPVPVYPVLVGSQQRPKDLAVGRLDYPEMVFQNDSAVVKATIRAAGFEGEDVTVELERVDRPDKAQTKTVRPNRRTTEVAFDIDASELGRQKYVLRLAARPDETREDNNERPFSVNVIDDEAHVLLLDGESRWEFRFLDNALTRDKHVQVSKVVFRQPYLGLLPETFFPRNLPIPAVSDDARESPFADFDAVIIGDLAPSHLPSGAWEWLDRFVRDDGGTVVMTAGRHSFPLAFSSEVVNGLLPVTGLHPVTTPPGMDIGPPQHRGFRLDLTPDGERQEMFQFDTDPLQNRRIWKQLPGHAFAIVGQARPAATVFASLADPRGRGGLEFERENAVIAHHYVGAGQVLWIGIDSTWRWRHRLGDLLHHRFWGQVSRWAAEFKASAGNEHVRFGLERPEIERGEDALIRARWNQRFLNRFPDLKARAEIRRHDDPDAEPVMLVDLERTETRPLVHEAKTAGLDAGDYTVRLVVENADVGDEPITAELTVTQRLTTELAELSANRNLLEQIAETTGGRLFFPHELDEIPALFKDVTESSSTQRDVTLWDHWLVLAVLFTLLTTEWALRKLNGLP